MTYKFSDYDALCIGKLIIKRRPEWSWNGIMKALEKAAMSGASLGQVTAAADLATMNPNAKTPAAILWDEHMNPPRSTTYRVSTERVCGECTRRRPIEAMTRSLQGVWTCSDCAGASEQEVDA